ncbi:hypothetical protein CsSME_00000616 [Camellia sinensis var. sinensis]
MPIPFLFGRSSYEALFSQIPNYSLFCVFVSACFVLLPHKDWTKLSDQFVLCVFLGYSFTQKGYRCYDPVFCRFYVSHHVSFFERLPYFQLPPIIASVSKKDLVHFDPFLSRSLMMSTSLLFPMNLFPLLLPVFQNSPGAPRR